MEIVFTFHNTYGAINGERLLLENGLAVRVMPLPACLGAGCGLCLRLPQADLDRALAILAGAAIEPQEVYLKKRLDGRTKYQAIVGPGKQTE